MSWAEIKHAINSTVGTDDFKPLDKIFEGNWRLASSDVVYKSEPVSYTYGYGKYAINNIFKAKASGRVKFRISGVETEKTTFTFNVYRNGSETPVASAANTTSTLSKTFIIDCNVNKGDIFTFDIKRPSTANDITSMGDIAVLCTPVYAPDLFETTII